MKRNISLICWKLKKSKKTVVTIVRKVISLTKSTVKIFSRHSILKQNSKKIKSPYTP